MLQSIELSNQYAFPNCSLKCVCFDERDASEPFGKPVRYMLLLNIAILEFTGLLILVLFDITCPMLVEMVKWLSHLLVAQTSWFDSRSRQLAVVMVSSSNL